MIKILQFLVLVYQKTLSPFMGNQCRFTPTCSCYMHEALEKHGAFKGLMLGIWRILRCNPLVKSSGTDPVPDICQWPFARSRLFGYKAPKNNIEGQNL